jgi:hypothetical protein
MNRCEDEGRAMRSNYLKASLNAATLAGVVLLSIAGVSSAQTVNLTASQQTTVLPDGSTVPMWGWTCGQVTQGTTAGATTGTSCTSLTYTTSAGAVAATPQPQSAAVTTGFAAGGGAWQPPLIVVPYTASAPGVSTTNLVINLTNALPVETSIMILGQAGGGLGGIATSGPGGSGPGTTAGPAREAGERLDGDHTTQLATTWTTVSGASSFTPPTQGARARSLVPEVCAPGTAQGQPCPGVGTVGGALNAGTYTWTGLKPGTYLIRSGTYPSIQGPMGLYGVLVVTQAPTTTAAGIAYPAVTATTPPTTGAVTYDADVVALESELDARQNNMVAAVFTPCSTTVTTNCAAAGASAAANANFLETAKWTPQCGAGPNGLTPSGVAPSCYPPAVDYTPQYFLINGLAFSKDAQQLSALSVAPAGTTGNVLVRFVNAGSHMHVPSVNGLDMLLVAEDANVLPDVAIALNPPAPATPKTLSANSTPTSANCSSTATIACGLNLRTEVFQPAGKVMDVIVSPARAATTYTAMTYQIYDRSLALATNNARDGGMQAILDVADANATTTFSGLNKTATVSAKSYSCAPGVTLVVSDQGKGVLAGALNVYGVELSPRPANGTNTLTPFGSGAATDSLTLNPDGTFTYTQAAANTSCGGSFTVQANGNGPTATITIGQATPVAPTANPDIYSSRVATLLRVGTPGVLANDTDPNGYPLTAVFGGSCTAPTGATALGAATTFGQTGVILTAEGSFTAKPPAAGTYYFCYQAKNSQNALSAAAAVTLTFQAGSNLKVLVKDAVTGAPITDYKWIVEQDLTFPINPACQVNTGTGARPAGCPAASSTSGLPPTPATNFHTSFMPVVAEGCTGPQSCGRGQTVYNPATGTHVAAACDGYGICTVGATQLTASTPDQAQLNATNPDGTPATYYISILSGDSQNAFAYGNSKDPSLTGSCTPGSNGNPATEPTGMTTSSACGHTMGGGPVPAASALTGGTCGTTAGVYSCTYPGGAPAASGVTAANANVTINLQPAPLKTATVTAFIFEDDFPLNGEPDTGGGVDALATLEVPLGDFQIEIWDTAGGIGDNTGQMTYDMFNEPLNNALNGTIDPRTGFDACPISNTGGVAVGVIIVCPLYESDGKTQSPLTGQAVVKNLMQGKYTLIAHPGAAREAAGEEWLQTNSLDGGHFLDSFIRSGEPPYFQEFGPGGWHVFFGFANPAHINARLAAICAGTSNTQIGGAFGGPATCHNNLNGQVTNLHQARSPNMNLYGGNAFAQGDPRNYAMLAYTNCYAAIGDTDGATIALAKCDPDGNFQFKNLPDGDYGLVLFDQWNDFIVDGSSHQITLTGGATKNVAYPVFTWQTHLWSRTYIDVGGLGRPVTLADGTLDPAKSPGLLQVPTRVRHVNGKFVNTLLSDIGGNSRFDETFPLFAFYTVESDTTRFRSTGVHVVNDSGGAPDTTGPYAGILNSTENFQLPSTLRVPGAYYCSNAACTDSTSSPPAAGGSGTSGGRIDPGRYYDVEGWQGGVSEFDMVDWGKQPYAAPLAGAPYGENGGIRGHVVNATTRPFDDPRMLFQNLWEPLVPRVTINLYKEGLAPDGTTTSLTLVDTTTTDSWDDWAQGFGQKGRSATTPNMSCTGQDNVNDPFFTYTLSGTPNYLSPGTPLPNSSQYKCYDGYHNLNQIQPATYDGLFHFPSATCMASNATFTLPNNPTAYHCATVANPAAGQAGAAPFILPPGKYVTEVVLPPGWQLNKEEDLNLLIGDQYIAPVTTPQFTGIGAIFITPDQASIDAANLSYTGPYTPLAGNGSSGPYTPPWSCAPGGGACTLTPSTTNNGKETQDYGRTSFGNFGPGALIVQSAPCVGMKRIVPDYLSISPESGEVAPFAGAVHALCDRKEITLGDQMQADVDFYIYTNTPKTTSFTGFISDDFSSEFDPASPAFGEKFAIPNVPVSIRDFNGQEISRLYSDQWGIFNGLVYSTWEVDPPNITGYSPNMMVTCMNDPGPIVAPVCPASTTALQPLGCVAANPPAPGAPLIKITDPSYNPAYSTFCYENPFMPGDTTYLDTPVVPVSAFAEGYNPPDCNYPDGTPRILSVVSNANGSGGPWVAAAGGMIYINALAPATPLGGAAGSGKGISVPNNAYSGPAAATAPYNQKSVTRHYGFGSAAGTVTIGGVTATGCSWSDAQITCPVPANVPLCNIQQVGASGVRCGELVITTANTAASGQPSNAKRSIDTVTVTVGGSAPAFVAGENVAGNAIQTAIDNAKPGDLIIVGCAAGQTSCTYNEMVLMWKPVRLQGIGDGAVTVNANTHPAGLILEPWRRKVNCLFGLALDGGFISPTHPYDPTNTYQCAFGTFTGYTVPAGGITFQGLVDSLIGEPIVGWDATLNGNIAELLQEPTLMGAYEGAGITVLAKGLENSQTANCGPEAFAGCIYLNNSTGSVTNNGFNNGLGDCNTASPFYSGNFLCNPSRVDGITFTNSSQGGGGVFVHGWAHNLEVANLSVHGNGGTLTGGITVGQMETIDPTLGGAVCPALQGQNLPGLGSATAVGTTVAAPLCSNVEVNVHNNSVTFNAAYGDELNSNTPASAGGVTLCTGADYYKFNSNWICGNWSSGDGGGVAHHGFSWNGTVSNNWILFNQSINPSLVTYGGGFVALGAAPDGPVGEAGLPFDIDVAPALSDGIGPALNVTGNVFQGNTAEEGSGGGAAFLHANGNDVANNPGNSSFWYHITVTNNIFANNVAGWAGGGVALLDAVNLDFFNNTVVSNDSTSSAGVEFNANGTPGANIPPPSPPGSSGPPCNPNGTTTNPTPGCPGYSFTTSVPLPAGLVTERHSANLAAAFTNSSVTCPANHGTGNQCTLWSVPYLVNDLFWQNRSFSIATNASNGTNAVVLSPVLNQTSTGSCPAEPAFSSTSGGYWDLGVYSDTAPGNHASGLTLAPVASTFSNSAQGYSGSNNTTAPGFPHQYCNGSRVPAEIATLLCATGPNANANAPGCILPGSVGVSTWGGVPDSATPPNPTFMISPAATIDEGNNWINMFYGPLTLTCPITTSTGAPGTCGTVPFNGPLGNYSTARPQGAHFTGTTYPFP